MRSISIDGWSGTVGMPVMTVGRIERRHRYGFMIERRRYGWVLAFVLDFRFYVLQGAKVIEDVTVEVS